MNIRKKLENANLNENPLTLGKPLKSRLIKLCLIPFILGFIPFLVVHLIIVITDLFQFNFSGYFITLIILFYGCIIILGSWDDLRHPEEQIRKCSYKGRKLTMKEIMWVCKSSFRDGIVILFFGFGMILSLIIINLIS